MGILRKIINHFKGNSSSKVYEEIIDRNPIPISSAQQEIWKDEFRRLAESLEITAR